MSQRLPESSNPEEHVNNKDLSFQNLLMNLAEQEDYVKAKAIQSFIYSYLSTFKTEQVVQFKSKAFLDALDEFSDLCGKFLLPSATSDSQHEGILTNNVENKIQNLQSASLCFDTIQKCLETFCDKNQGILLITFALKILSQGYTHCKESDAIYGEVFEQFVEKLGIFFKRNISSLEKIVLQQLNVLGAGDSFEDEFDVNSILLELGNLCQVVSNLESDIAFDFWTSYIKVVTNHHKHLKQSSGIDSVLTHLTLKNLEIIEVCKLSLDKNFEKDEAISSKFTFYFDVLLNFINFVQSKQEISLVRTLLLKLYDFLILCYCPFTPDEINLEPIKSSIKKNAYTLLSHFSTDEAFVKSLLLLDPIETNGLQTGHIILMLCALSFMKCSLNEDNFKHIVDNLLLSKDDDDMKLLNVSIPQCTITKANSDQLVVLYQYAYEQISECLKSLPDAAVFNLESVMLKCLESSTDVISLLISDVWIYRLRCSSVEFLYHQCDSILKKYSTKTHLNYKMQSFIKRVVKFLPQSYKKQILQDFSNLQFVIDGNQSVQHRYGIPNFYLPENVSRNADQMITVLLSKFNESSSADVYQLIERACSCLELCTLFVNAVGSTEILQFIEFAAHVFKSDVYEVQIAVLTFIKELARKSLPENTHEFMKIISSMARLFSEAIHSKNYIVKFEALHTFSYFAKCTPHVRIVQETVRCDPSLKPLIKSYMAAVPDNGFLSEKEKLEYLELQSSTFEDINLNVLDQSTQQFLQQVLPQHKQL